MSHLNIIMQFKTFGHHSLKLITALKCEGMKTL